MQPRKRGHTHNAKVVEKFRAGYAQFVLVLSTCESFFWTQTVQTHPNNETNYM